MYTTINKIANCLSLSRFNEPGGGILAMLMSSRMLAPIPGYTRESPECGLAIVPQD